MLLRLGDCRFNARLPSSVFPTPRSFLPLEAWASRWGDDGGSIQNVATEPLVAAVTLAGWAALLKGLSLLLVPPHVMAKAYYSMGFERYFYLWMGAVLVLGLWLALKAVTA